MNSFITISESCIDQEQNQAQKDKYQHLYHTVFEFYGIQE